jgi:outer membrane protein OmpA-like peptidoglycan-associated protein
VRLDAANKEITVNVTRRIVGALLCAAFAIAPSVVTTSVPAGATETSDTLVALSGAVGAVNCPTSTFCAAADDNGYVFTDTNGSWSAPSALEFGIPVTALSCASSSFCMTGDEFGNSYVFRGTSWDVANAPDGSQITGISCPTSTFCMAVTENGNALTTQDGGNTWATTAVLPDGNALVAVSCLASPSTFCVVTDDAGNADVYNGTVWITYNVTSDPLVSVSCPTADFCAAANDQGDVFTYDGSNWTASPPLLGISGPAVITCPTASFCLVGDANGNVYANNDASNDGAWTPDPTNPVDENGAITAISCSSATSCVITDDVGHALVYVPQVAPSGPTIANIPVPATVGRAFAPTVTTNSDGTTTILDTTATVCSLSGSIVSFLTTGTCDLQVTTAATAAYLAGTGNVQTFAVTPVPIVSLLPENALDVTNVNGVVGVPLTLGTSGGSGAGAVIFEVVSAGSAQCSLFSPATVTAIGAGSCTVVATKAADGTYAATSSVATEVTFVSPLTTSSPPTKRPTTSHHARRIIGPFANDTGTLDLHLASTVRALATAAQRDDDHRVLVTGFASAAGLLKENEALSRERARVVAAALRTDFAHLHFSVTITTVGGGVGSAPTPAANRVVEVALR